VNVEDVKHRIARQLRRVGFDASRLTQGDGLSDADRETVRVVAPFTMTSPERIAAACEAVRYVCRNGVEGSIVECGVWRGGSMMAAARALLAEGDTGRRLFLYDTFAGMTEPTDADLDRRGRSASRWMRRYGRTTSGDSRWCHAPVDDVARNIASVGYPEDRCTFVAGRVEETIPATMPGPIAVLRLDTDWYESTAHELEHLFPLLVPGGVLILDDYGHWQGARRAVDEYLARHRVALLLTPLDYTGRMAVVPGLPAPGVLDDS
jgi:O-methyltransferase